MSQCPFCAGQVEEAVTIYGGTCPHCFAVIPGEEAATDPGDDVKEQLAEADRKRARRRALLPFAVAAPVVVMIVVGALYVALRPEPELAVLDLDDGEFYMPDLDNLVVAEVRDEPRPASEAVRATPASDPPRTGTGDPQVATTSSGSTEPKTAAASKTEPKIEVPRIRTANLGKSGESEEDLLAGLKEQGVADVTRTVRTGTGDMGAEVASDLDISSRLSTGTVSSGTGFTMDAGAVSQEMRPLSNAAEIARMIQGVLRRQLPRLRTCYESSLRANPDLRGSWALTFTVQTDGTVAKAAATAQGSGDATFEQCMSQRIEQWRFQRITKPQPVKKTVDFTR